MVISSVMFLMVMIAVLALLGYVAGTSSMAKRIVPKFISGIALSVSDFKKDESADMVGYAIELTVTLIILAILFIPVGYKTWMEAYTNKTDYGIVAGSTDDTLLQYLGTFAVLGFFLAFIYAAKSKASGA